MIRNKEFALALFCAIASFVSSYAATAVNPVNLRTEYLINPIGLDAMHPRLTWMLADERQGAKQTAYQIFVGTDSAAVSKGTGNNWTTVKTVSSNILAVYQGKALQPYTKYFWRVTVWDKDGKKAAPSAVNSFETGLMKMTNWKGSWISDDENYNVKPAPYFRTTFGTGKRVISARAYIAAAGLYELYINGQKIGNHRLDPMYTRFDRRTLYVTYDVTSSIAAGKNAIGVLLGNGWYNHQSTAVWNFHLASWRNRPAFCMDLRITYDDGSVETISTNDHWKTDFSPVTLNSIYTAEHYDARLEQPGWNTINFDDKKWKPAFNRPVPSQNIVAQALHPILDVETIPAKTVNKFDDKTYVFDLGRNISGVSKITVSGKEGTVIRLKHGERLYKDGHVDLSNIDLHYRPTDDKDPFQVDIFTLSGKGQETFMPKFNYKGFQYVEVTSSEPVKLTKESLTGYFMHSDVPPVGNINTSNPIINKIWYATNNSYLSNLFGYPTDCPQREKNGWTGDAHIAAETGLYNFDGITVYEKWMADHRDEQQPNGTLPSIIPTAGWGYEWGNGPDWTSTIALIPWNVYLFYGDTKILADNYENITRYVNHINDLYPTGLTTWGLGDWVPVKSVSPVEVTSTAYYFADVTIAAKAAKILGKADDAAKYTALATKIKNAFNAKYLNEQTGNYNKGLQTELAVPLYWGLVPDAFKAKIAARLAARVAADNFHLDVGILGGKAILGALSDNGYPDVAYKIASQETYPSWGWWMVNGATTLYENWKIDAKSDISLNHIMFGNIGAWLYSGIGGIKPDERQPGFKNVLLQPNFVPNLNQYGATHKSPYGDVASNWKRNGDAVTYTVVLPANTSADIRFPLSGGKKAYLSGKPVTADYHVTAGRYEFIIK
ncbi:alpha-L-rhamnosidase [Mucilaginibacter phyllosphaerae]|uniref:alpha-L-rhamnosidase n=1 Tax=Mucilaginibacter phyllosphaerae TaxID=1812349 RepID=A0A4Y8ALJ7_9SPHI|nr:alpha-L-rhamnosidase [Mucilaginibacter phyllosphaerae]MBB3967643.1 alpha-L-rhamnosidase [Mucilaginibacter phyllosphaerae]TEW69301.1 alpha-rhamnosidase [Mucilaginibacter phyllosphaerae]GGH04251.1 alpha-rhamnosidase [Mucilaginibacter phyllosphaerae]